MIRRDVRPRVDDRADSLPSRRKAPRRQQRISARTQAMSRGPRVTFIVLLVGLLLPVVAGAQGSSGIAGVARDTTGAVLPGVTVEASSPALIEKTRSVVTDSQGRYAIIDLRPGTYTVTFTLTGFSTVRREGIEVTASFTATANADLRVGEL